MQPVQLQSQVSAQILDHIRARNLKAGERLKEQALADAFKVSRAPVRAALRALEIQGIVRSELNRGFFLTKNAADLTAISPEAAPDSDDEPYLAVASDRLSGILPERISENELMRRYGLPRGQVLKILARIAQEGWAERLPGRGWMFLPVLDSRESYDQGYRFRAAVEAAALLEPAFKIDVPALNAARGQQQDLLDGDYLRLPRARLFEINSRFHEMIMEWSGNRFYLDALRRLNGLRRLLEYRVTVDRSRLIVQCQEHLEILARLEGGNLLSASRYLAEHIDNARRLKAPSVTNTDCIL